MARDETLDHAIFDHAIFNHTVFDHTTMATMPWRSAGARAGTLDLHLPVGVPAELAGRVRLHWTVRGVTASVGVGAPGEAARLRPLGEAVGEALARDARPDPVRGSRWAGRPYALMRSDAGQGFVVGEVFAVPEGSTVEHWFTVDDTDLVSRRYRLHAVRPRFGPDDVVWGQYGEAVSPDAGHPLVGYAWLAAVRREGASTHVRLDLDDIDLLGRRPIAVEVDGVRIEAAPVAAIPQEQVDRAWVDPYTDSVEFTFPGSVGSSVVVDVFGVRTVLPTVAPREFRTRVLVAQFCIQGFNDLLEEPVGQHPPRTYAQASMFDPEDDLLSRPRAERNEADGYRFGLDAHRRFDVPYHLVLNGGFLTLLAHDCPEDLALLSADVEDGLVHPAVTGFGSHRITCYGAQANLRDNVQGRRLIENLLGRCSNLAYYDQRHYDATSPGARAAFRAGFDLVVADSDTGWFDWRHTARASAGSAGRALSSSFVWRDERTGAHVLFIDDELKDSVYDASLVAWGKPLRQVRLRLLRAAVDEQLRGNVFTIGDDFEKSCGNGWFEGQGPVAAGFSSFLEWISGRPWLRPVTSGDLDVAEECVGTLDMRSSTDDWLDPGGARSLDVAGHRMHFDSWVDAWREFPCDWAGGTIGQITDAVERALRGWPRPYRNRFWEEAWLAFLAAQHENAWNKQPLEKGDPNSYPVGPPEDFVVAAGLQLRNTFVWLKASVWASWAAAGGSGSFVTDGSAGDPVNALVAALDPRLAADVGGLRPLLDVVSWDGDPMGTFELYDERRLCVLDRNGGRITHVFSRAGDGLRTVSGTLKTYQYRGRDGVECDGWLLQSTVSTPNHRYVAADVSTVADLVLDWDDGRPRVPGPVRRRVPDLFNGYECAISGAGVECRHVPGGFPELVPSEAELRASVDADRSARRTGGAPVVWHGPQDFTKRLTLTPTGVSVEYRGVEVGHRVDNEFCVDQHDAIFSGEPATVLPGADRWTVRRPARGTGPAPQVVLVPGAGCEFDPVTTGAGLSRILTATARVRATATDFSYTIELP